MIGLNSIGLDRAGSNWIGWIELDHIVAQSWLEACSENTQNGPNRTIPSQFHSFFPIELD